MHAAHEVVLRGHHGNRLARDVVPFGQAVLVDVLEMPRDLVFRHIGERKTHVVGPFALHLAVYGGAYHVAWLQLIDEAPAVRIKQHGAFAAARFRDQKRAAGLGGVQRGGVNLHVVGVLKRDVVGARDVQRVAGEAGEVRGALVRAADAAARPHRCLRVDAQRASGGVECRDAAATLVARAVFAGENIVHARVFQDAHVAKLAHGGQQLRGDLGAGGVVVEADARAAVRALARVAQLAGLVAFEVHAVVNQAVDDAAAGANHQVYAFAAVFEMSGAQRVLEERRVVVSVVLHADAALRQHGVALVDGGLRQDDHGKLARQVKRAVQPGHAAAHDDHVAGDCFWAGAWSYRSVLGCGCFGGGCFCDRLKLFTDCIGGLSLVGRRWGLVLAASLFATTPGSCANHRCKSVAVHANNRCFR